MESMEQRMAALESAMTRVQRRLRVWQGLTAISLIGALLLLGVPQGVAEPLSPARRGGLPGLRQRVKALARRVAALEALLVHFSVEGNDIFITGANLHLRNGLGATNGNPENPFATDPADTMTNGLGNLIVGYNEAPLGACERSGSHNVVVGIGHTFSQFGGLVVGQQNSITGPYASVSGGQFSTASNVSAAVSGGSENTANGIAASVSGGLSNFASGQFAAVSGGSFNMATAASASVSGGTLNLASGLQSSVSGGTENAARSSFAAVSGGTENVAIGIGASVSGGNLNTASGLNASVTGGARNTASGAASTVSGGANRVAPGQFDWVAGSLFEDF